MQASPVEEVDRSQVLGKATGRAAEGLGLNGRLLALTLGVSEPTVSRILRGERGIDPQSKPGQLSLMLVRVFRSLDALVGSDATHRVAWMGAHNSALNGVPSALILSPEGLARTLAYLDGMRAPI